jgi:hypothetical protein
MEIPASHPSSSKPAGFTTGLLVIVHGLAWGGFFLWMHGLVSEGQRISTDLRTQYQIALPALTEWVLGATGWITSGIYLPLIFIVLFLALDGWLLFILRHETKNRELSWVWFVFLILMLGVITGFTKWALVSLPLKKLAEALSR